MGSESRLIKLTNVRILSGSWSINGEKNKESKGLRKTNLVDFAVKAAVRNEPRNGVTKVNQMNFLVRLDLNNSSSSRKS